MKKEIRIEYEMKSEIRMKSRRDRVGGDNVGQIESGA